jgi:hypothetical protein
MYTSERTKVLALEQRKPVFAWDESPLALECVWLAFVNSEQCALTPVEVFGIQYTLKRCPMIGSGLGFLPLEKKPLWHLLDDDQRPARTQNATH